MNESYRPTWVEVDLEAIRDNARILKPENAELMAVVKADGYGHGDVEVARAAIEAGATWMGVALVEEGLELRAAGIEAPILVLSELPAGSEAVALAHRLTPTLYSGEGLERLSAAARGSVPVHIKIDTGMHRVGVWPPEEAPAFALRVQEAGLEVEGLFTHFARSEEDEVTTKEQLGLFLESAEAIRSEGVTPRLLHAANSGATILHPDSHLDLVRPGIALYGIEPAPGIGSHLGLRPALTWRSQVSAVKRLAAGEAISYGQRYRLERDAWVATVPVGYADGYPRQLTNVGEVLIGGRRCRVAGTVTMDQLVVDCGDGEVRFGDDVVLIGEQGSETIGADALGRLFGTIGYEIVSRIGERVPRRYS
ncbi:MAG TPA: alanine racemase [Actinomycetota bacterium]|nr:alanine racemase [Actinomycetota bacterium]